MGVFSLSAEKRWDNNEYGQKAKTGTHNRSIESREIAIALSKH